jgi:hypothetical protein
MVMEVDAKPLWMGCDIYYWHIQPLSKQAASLPSYGLSAHDNKALLDEYVCRRTY